MMKSTTRKGNSWTPLYFCRTFR